VEGSRKFERPPDVGPNNIWWDNYKTVSDYIKRLCWLMTDSVNTADVAVLCGEEKLDFKETAVLYQNQIEFNYLEDIYLTRENIKNGHVYVQKNKYRILLVPEGVKLSGEKKLWLTECGVTVVPAADGVLKEVRREVTCPAYEPDLRFSHRVKDGGDFYLFVNEGESPIETVLKINKVGACEYWLPFEGEIKKAEVLDFDDNYVSVKLSLPYRESVILYIDDRSKPEKYAVEMDLTGVYTVTDGNLYIPSLKNDDKTFLTLGAGYEYAELYINEKKTDIRMWHPYQFDITGFAVAGENTVRVSVKDGLVYEYNPTMKKPEKNTEWFAEVFTVKINQN
jgi:hypothetical protein